MGSIMIDILSRFKGTRLGTYLRRRRWNAGIMSEQGARKKVAACMSEASEAECEAVVADILDMARKYRFSADEYFYYHFSEKSEEERKCFISDLNRVDIVESLNKAKNLAIFDDKLRSVSVFGKYYRRKVCGVQGPKDKAAFLCFAREQKKFIVKPLTGTCGRGVQIVDLSECNNESEMLEQLFAQYCEGSKDGFIAEELIVQVPELAQLHPSSVNSVRIATIRYNEGAEVLAAFLRTGRGTSVVDNAGAGGIICTLDIKTGRVIAAADEYGNSYTQLVEFEVPQWEEAKSLARELALVVDGNRYAGWDLALTENGWVMVEGNARGQFVWQIPTQKGFWPEMNKVLKRLGMPESSNKGIG